LDLRLVTLAGYNSRASRGVIAASQRRVRGVSEEEAGPGLLPDDAIDLQAEELLHVPHRAVRRAAEHAVRALRADVLTGLRDEQGLQRLHVAALVTVPENRQVHHAGASLLERARRGCREGSGKPRARVLRGLRRGEDRHVDVARVLVLARVGAPRPRGHTTGRVRREHLPLVDDVLDAWVTRDAQRLRERPGVATRVTRVAIEVLVDVDGTHDPAGVRVVVRPSGGVTGVPDPAVRRLVPVRPAGVHLVPQADEARGQPSHDLHSDVGVWAAAVPVPSTAATRATSTPARESSTSP